MKVKCTFALKHMNMTVGKEYETTYVESKSFLDYGIPYLELIDDKGEPIGWAPCDMEALRFEKYPTLQDAHGVEGQIPLARMHEIDKDYKERFLGKDGFHREDAVDELLEMYRSEDE